jgi:hypothetical protein
MRLLMFAHVSASLSLEHRQGEKFPLIPLDSLFGRDSGFSTVVRLKNIA